MSRSELIEPPPPLLIDDTLRLHELSNKPIFVDHAAMYRGLTEEQLTKQNGGKLPWDHSLKSENWLEERAPNQIKKEWLEPKNKPKLGFNGKFRLK